MRPIVVERDPTDADITTIYVYLFVVTRFEYFLVRRNQFATSLARFCIYFFHPYIPLRRPVFLLVTRSSSFVFARELHIFIYPAAAYFLTLRFIWSSTGGGGNGDRPRFISDDNNLRTNFGGVRRVMRPRTTNERRVKRLRSSVGLAIVSMKSRNQYARGVIMSGSAHYYTIVLQIFNLVFSQTYGSYIR